MRRLLSVLAALVLTISAAIAPSSAFAASIGSCGGQGGAYVSGEVDGPGIAYYGVYASVLVPGSGYFGPCSPNDFNGPNASAVQIGITENCSGCWPLSANTFVTLGILISNHCGSGWPSSICNGARHFYAEEKGAFPGDYHMWDLGGATAGVAHDLQITYGICGNGHVYCWYIDGGLALNYDMGAGMVPTNTNQQTSWQVETRDVGDGLGTVTSATNLGQMETYYNRAWHNSGSGSSCDVTSSQHGCVVNGAQGFYAYTPN